MTHYYDNETSKKKKKKVMVQIVFFGKGGVMGVSWDNCQPSSEIYKNMKLP